MIRVDEGQDKTCVDERQKDKTVSMRGRKTKLSLVRGDINPFLFDWFV